MYCCLVLVASLQIPEQPGVPRMVRGVHFGGGVLLGLLGGEGPNPKP